MQSLLNSATTRALMSTLYRCHKACNGVWQDVCSQRYKGGPPGRYFHLYAADVALRQPCGWQGWPGSRWALRHSRQMSSSAWKVIRRDLQEGQVDGCSARTTHLLCCPCYYGGRQWTVTPGPMALASQRGPDVLMRGWRDACVKQCGEVQK